eukprot:1340619-Pyramimonas_sp.AAC.1
MLAKTSIRSSASTQAPRATSARASTIPSQTAVRSRTLPSQTAMQSNLQAQRRYLEAWAHPRVRRHAGSSARRVFRASHIHMPKGNANSEESDWEKRASTSAQRRRPPPQPD